MKFCLTTRYAARAVLFGAIALCAAWVSAADEGESFHRFWPDNLFAVDFVTDQTGYIAGQAGTVLRTRDGGEQWDALYIGTDELIRRVSFVTESEGWAVGHRGSILHTANSGDSWEVQHEVPGTYLRDVTFVDNQHGWVVGHDAVILHTADGGATWQVQQMRGFTGRDLPRFHGVYAKDKDTAVVVGEFGTVVHTEDAGELWTITPDVANTTWLAVDGTAGHIYMAGLDGNAAYLTLASEEQRATFEREKLEWAAKEEAKARKKAKRRKKVYVPKIVEEIPRSSIEYAFHPVGTGTKEHLFDLAAGPAGAIAVGRSTVLGFTSTQAQPVEVDNKLPIDFVWFGGISIAPQGDFWLVGIRGLVAHSDASGKKLSPAFNLGASENIRLVSSKWAKNNGQ